MANGNRDNNSKDNQDPAGRVITLSPLEAGLKLETEKMCLSVPYSDLIWDLEIANGMLYSSLSEVLTKVDEMGYDIGASRGIKRRVGFGIPVLEAGEGKKTYSTPYRIIEVMEKDQLQYAIEKVPDGERGW